MRDEDASSTVHSCTFTGNVASTSGGGMYINDSSNAKVINCTFSGNEAGRAGGIASDSNINLRVIDSTFCGNSLEDIVGPVVLDGVSMSTACPVPVCQSDTNGDGEVNVLDFLELLANWGPCE